MILCDRSIANLCHPINGERPLIFPCHPRTKVNGMSYGLSMAGYDLRCDQAVVLVPGDFALVSTIEQLCMPNDVMGLLKDKSTWARQGLSVFNTVFEPGWMGFPTIELKNQGRSTLVINKGDPLAQMIFMKLDAPCVEPYTGKYQNQGAEPVPAILE